jgi:hypothetical protein
MARRRRREVHRLRDYVRVSRSPAAKLGKRWWTKVQLLGRLTAD